MQSVSPPRGRRSFYVAGPDRPPMPDAPPLAEHAPLAAVDDGRRPAASGPCAACGEGLAGRFCHACGERGAGTREESLAAFVREQVHEATSADGRLWRTVKALFVPGKLTEEYLDGRRTLYVRPIRIFLVLNVLLFFALSGSPGTILRGPLQTHFGAAVYGDVARTLAAAEAVRWDAATREAGAVRGVPGAVAEPTPQGVVPEYETAFDAQAQALAPSLVGVLIPGYALLIAVLLWPARASGVRHVVFATHLVAATIAVAFVLMMAIEGALGVVRAVWDHPRWADSMDPILVVLAPLAFALYIGAAVRRVYDVPVWVSAVAGVFLGTVGFAFAFWCFRLVLFAVTLWTLDVPAN